MNTPQPNVVEALAAARPANPLLERLRIPGTTYRLPSQGQFYTNGELDPSVKNGEVEVRPMTAIDEIILSTPDKLLSGKAIEEIFAHCVPQILKPGQLLSKDVDFLMVCLRAVSFGNGMDITYQHDCPGALNQTYTVNLDQMIRQSRSIDPTKINEEYNVTLPNGQVVTLKPLTYSAMTELYQTTMMTSTENITAEEAEVIVVNTLVSLISSVDGVTDAELIRQWVIQLPLGWKKTLEGQLSKVSNWGISLSTEQVCHDCKQPMEVMISPNPVSFFT